MAANPPQIRRLRPVVVYRNGYGALHDDEVLSPGGTGGRYLRWAWSGRGVLVIPRRADELALVPMYRYPIGAVSLEFPRGACDADEPAEAAAARELLEETGHAAVATRKLGQVHAETGLIESAVTVFVADVAPNGAGARADQMESMAAPVFHRLDDIARLISIGEITCGLTMAAYAMLLSAEKAHGSG